MLISCSKNRNAVTSPLLRLPGELRNVIWVYASYVPAVEIGGKYSLPCRGRTLDQALQQREDSMRSAFYLPQVCRQIYVETASMAYALCTFIVSDSIIVPRISLMILEIWRRRLPLAHANAITAIEMSEDMGSQYFKRDSKVTLKDTFPALELVKITWEVMVNVMDFIPSDEMGEQYELECKKLMKEDIREREGEHVELVFLW